MITRDEAGMRVAGRPTAANILDPAEATQARAGIRVAPDCTRIEMPASVMLDMPEARAQNAA